MSTVRSKDGTEIAYTRDGAGPAVVLVGGGLDDGSENAVLAPAMAGTFTVINYARRGRGRSGNTPPYTLDREIEDLAALIDEAGGHVHLFGASSGGALVLEAAAAGLPIDRIAVWEVPYAVDESTARDWQNYVDDLGEALHRDDRDLALTLFMQLAGSPEEMIAHAKGSEYWPGMLELAPTLAHDAACLGDGYPPVSRLGAISQPTLVLTGPGEDAGSGNLPADYMGNSADAIAAAVPTAERRRLGKGTHMVDAEVLGPVLIDWFQA